MYSKKQEKRNLKSIFLYNVYLILCKLQQDIIYQIKTEFDELYDTKTIFPNIEKQMFLNMIFQKRLVKNVNLKRKTEKPICLNQ